MLVHTFTGLSKKYAAVMGRKSGVHVLFAGSSAGTDGSTITLPAMPLGTTLTKRQYLVMSGYLDHEVAHIRRSFPAPVFQPTQKLLKWLWNLVEDVRIEAETIDEYPGTKEGLDALARELDEKAVESLKDQNPTPTQILFVDMFRRYRDFDSGLLPFSLTDVEHGRTIQKFLDKHMRRLRTSQDSLRVASVLYAWANRELKGQDPGTGGEEPLLSESQLQDLIELKSKRIVDELAQEIKEEPLNNPDEKRTVKWGDRVLPPATTRYDIVRKYTYQGTAWEKEAIKRRTAKAAAAVGLMRKRTTVTLMSQAKKSWERDLQEGALDTTRLARLKTGEMNIFKQRRITRAVNTALEVGTDFSASMKAEEVAIAQAAIAECFCPVRHVKTRLWTITTKDDDDIIDKMVEIAIRTGRNNYGRLEPLLITVLKDYDEAYSRAIQNILSYIGAQANTPLGDAYAYGYESLLRRPEKRRMLWLISDGTPYLNAIGSSEHSELEMMELTRRKCHRAGIETVGLHIDKSGANVLAPFVDYSVTIKDHNELAQGMLTLAGQLAR